jgi:Flp pilus assembly protein TadG
MMGLQRLRRALGLAAKERSGQSLIEFALVAPLFLLISFGIFEYAIVLLTYCNATYACRKAARYGSMHSSSSLSPVTIPQLQAMVKSQLFLNSAITPVVNVSYVTPTFGAGSNTVGDLVGVSVNWNQSLQLPFMSSSSFSIQSQDYKMINR